jgi:site-specific DNA recombinase
MSRTPRPDLYVCPGPPHGGCSGTAITADHADLAVRDLVVARLDSIRNPAYALGPEHIDRVVAEQEDDVARLDDLSSMWIAGEITRPEWLQIKRKIERRMDARRAEVKRLRSLYALGRLAGQGTSVANDWPELTQAEQRDIIHGALDHVVVLPAARPRAVFRPERLAPVWREW